MAEIIDLKKVCRLSGEGFVAQIDNEVVDVIDISVAGVRLARPITWLGRRHIEFRLIPRLDGGLDYHRAIPVCGHIVGDGPDHLRVAYSAVTPALANVIGRYKGRPRGIIPSLAAHHLLDRAGQLLQ